MKFLVLSVFLCVFVTASTAQTTKSPAIVRMQTALGSMLSVVRDISVATSALIKNTDDSVALNAAYSAAEELYQLFPTFGTANSSSLPLPSRTRLTNAFSAFQDAVGAWEAALDGRTAANLTTTFQNFQKEFLNLAGVVYTL
uniref:13.3 kDa salivary protein n=1 Tax=Anopheles maculatus TaxID=74869 RepID=A0A182SBK0_9DIPT